MKYTTNAGESLAGIASRELGCSTRWQKIRDANEERFPHMGPNDYYPPGTEINLPPVTPHSD